MCTHPQIVFFLVKSCGKRWRLHIWSRQAFGSKQGGLRSSPRESPTLLFSPRPCISMSKLWAREGWGRCEVDGPEQVPLSSAVKRWGRGEKRAPSGGDGGEGRGSTSNLRCWVQSAPRHVDTSASSFLYKLLKNVQELVLGPNSLSHEKIALVSSGNLSGFCDPKCFLSTLFWMERTDIGPLPSCHKHLSTGRPWLYKPHPFPLSDWVP